MSFAVPFADRTKVLLKHSAVFPNSAVALPPSLPICAQVNEALDRGETHYTDRPGILPLREKLAASLKKRFNVSSDAKNDIIITCGVTEARFVAIQQLLQSGQTIGAPSHSDRIFGPALLRRVTLQSEIAPNTALIYVTSSMAEETLRTNLAAAPSDAIVLFEVDEQRGHFHPSQIAGFESRTVTIGDLGDESWRVGYLVSPGSFSPALRDFKQALTICSTNLSQWAGLSFEELS